MSRNIDKDIREYRRLYWHRKDRTGGFYANDAIAIMQFTEEENKAWDVPRVSFTSFAVFNALEAGFMVGYRKGKKDEQQRQREKRKNS